MLNQALGLTDLIKVIFNATYGGDWFLETFFVSIDQCVCGFSFKRLAPFTKITIYLPLKISCWLCSTIIFAVIVQFIQTLLIIKLYYIVFHNYFNEHKQYLVKHSLSKYIIKDG